MENEIRQILIQKPGLKGREIAKKMGVERKKVNSFLDKNRDKFHQDEGYLWSVTDDDSVTVEFESGWIDSYSFERTLLLYPDLFAIKNKRIKFVIPKGCKLLLISIAKFLALVNQLSASDNVVEIDLSDCRDTRTYFNRTGFFDHLNQVISVIPDRPEESWAEKYKGNSETLVEFGTINPKNKNKSLIIELGNIFVKKSNERFKTAALTVFSEMIGNVSEHSESDVEGFAALQFYSPPHKPNHIQTVISDSGLGVCNTLRPALKDNYPSLYSRFSDADVESDIGLVTEVFTKGNISRFGGARGLGFKSSREQATKFDANLSIRQDEFSIELIYRNGQFIDSKVERNLSRILGTHICFDFIVD